MNVDHWCLHGSDAQHSGGWMTRKPLFVLFAACIVGCSDDGGEPTMFVDMGDRELDVTIVSTGEAGFDGGLELDARYTTLGHFIGGYECTSRWRNGRYGARHGAVNL